jgi:hypothetical protein
MPSVNKAIKFMLLGCIACVGSLANAESERLLQGEPANTDLPGLPQGKPESAIPKGPKLIPLSNYKKAVTQFDGVLADEVVNYLSLKAD